MAEKVKVSRVIAEALRTVLSNGNISSCIEKHVHGWDYEPKFPLKKLTTEEFARCCLTGYEVEETPEERLLKIYQAHEERPSIQPVWNDGVVDGIKMALDTLNIKIKGINEWK